MGGGRGDPKMGRGTYPRPKALLFWTPPPKKKGVFSTFPYLRKK